MENPDLNQLHTLCVLLEEGSVAQAARRLGLSSSAMSRALARLRMSLQDPLLVRAGRGLTPSPRALEIRAQASRLLHEAHAILRPAASLVLADVERTFTLRCSEGFVENFGPALVQRIAAHAPGIRMRFMSKLDKEATLLRSGAVDFETGVVQADGAPELRSQTLFQDRFVVVMRADHPLTRQSWDLQAYLGASHIRSSRRGERIGPIDQALQDLGHKRRISCCVSGFAGALALARGTDMLATVPERHSGVLRAGMCSQALPFDMPSIRIALIWHPRMDGDQAHRWVRGCVREVIQNLLPDAT